MKKCPYCAEEIQDEAKVCRHCHIDLVSGKPILKSSLTQPQIKEVEKRIRVMDGVRIGVGIFIVLPLIIIGIIIVIIMFFGGIGNLITNKRELAVKESTEKKVQNIKSIPVVPIDSMEVGGLKSKIKDINISRETSKSQTEFISNVDRDSTISLRLIGISFNKSRPQDTAVMVEDSANEKTYYIKKGDIINGYLLKEVKEKSIILEKDGHTFELR